MASLWLPAVELLLEWRTLSQIPAVGVRDTGWGSPGGMRWGRRGGVLGWTPGGGLGRREAWRCGLGGEVSRWTSPESREGGGRVCREGGQALVALLSEVW